MLANDLEISHNVEFITAKYRGNVIFTQTYDPMFLEHEYEYAFNKAKDIAVNQEIKNIAKLPPTTITVDRMIYSIDPDTILAASLKAYTCFHVGNLVNIRDLVHYELPYDLILKNGTTYVLGEQK